MIDRGLAVIALGFTIFTLASGSRSKVTQKWTRLGGFGLVLTGLAVLFYPESAVSPSLTQVQTRSAVQAGGTISNSGPVYNGTVIQQLVPDHAVGANDKNSAPVTVPPLLPHTTDTSVFKIGPGATVGHINIKNSAVEGIDHLLDSSGQVGSVVIENLAMSKEGADTFPPPNGKYRSYSSVDLVKTEAVISKKLRSLEILLDNDENISYSAEPMSHENPLFYEHMIDQYQKKFENCCHLEALYISEELWRRAGKIQRNDKTPLSVRIGWDVVKTGILSGDRPLSGAADFLDYLVDHLGLQQE